MNGINQFPTSKVEDNKKCNLKSSNDQTSPFTLIITR